MKNTVQFEIGKALFEAAFQAYGDELMSGLSEEQFCSFLEIPSDISHGDYALPCFKLARVFKKAPPVICNDIDQAFSKHKTHSSIIEKLNPLSGFLNIFINKAELGSRFLPEIESGHFFKLDEEKANERAKMRAMVEYSQPNTHKEFHVGHGRNVCLGDCIYRLYRYLGFNAISANYIGDEGAHIAKCLYAIEQVGGMSAVPAKNGASWIGEQYVVANTMLEEADGQQKEKIEVELSQILAAIESKTGPIYDLWLKTRAICMEDFYRIYDWLGVKFDHYFYESEVSEEAQQIVDEFVKKNLFEESEGAIGVDMKGDKLGFMMVRKSDGNTLYITKDIALAKRKFEDFKIHKNIYVVGSEQEFHFKQLFNFFKMAKFEHAKDCYHLSYGMVRRSSGKMSSRLGNSFTFQELVDLLKEHLNIHLEKYRGDWSDEEIARTSDMLAVGAIKYGMLNSDPKKDVIFEPENWTRFDGNSGPYLMYCYSRSQSILEKAQAKSFIPSYKEEDLQLLTEEAEGRLLFEMYRFNEVVEESLEHFRPSNLAQYLYQLCKLFNQFYVQVPVLKEKESAKLAARLSLIASFSKLLKTGLHLLGIDAPKRM